MFTYEDSTKVDSLQLSAIPERSHVHVSLYTSEHEVGRIGGHGVLLDVYTLSAPVSDDRATISAKAMYGKSGYDGNLVVLDRAKIDDVLKVGKTVRFEQFQNFGRTLQRMYDEELRIALS